MTALGPLLAHSIIDINRDFDAAVTANGEDARLSLVLRANLLRAIPDAGISFSDLPAATRTSRRVLKTAEGFAKRGLLEITPLARRGKWWRLTSAGAHLRDRGEELVRTAEAAWRAKVGKRRVDRVRAALEGVVGQLDLELPHYPISRNEVARRLHPNLRQ